MKTWTRLILSGATAFLLITAFFSSPVMAFGGPCKTDIEKFCKDKPKGRELAKCLTDHKADLSPTCKEKYRDMVGRLRHTFEACQDDAEKFCADVKPGGGALVKCLVSHKAELSQGCKDATDKNKKKKR